jgi:F0F1-type ATP synthase membrane subunit b/b'
MISKNFIIFFLFSVIILSKEILVFNEELLILFAFLIFLLFLRNYISYNISKELDSRSLKIKEDFDFFRNMQKKTFTYSIDYHTKQKFLNTEIIQILKNLKESILLILSAYNNKHIKIFNNQLDDKLKKIISHYMKLKSVLQNKISCNVFIFLKFQYVKNKKMRKLIFKRSTLFLSNIK